MRQRVIIDTGLLVAFLNRRDRAQRWVRTEWDTIEPPLLTCEAVLAEACFLLQNIYGGKETVISLVNTGVVHVPFRLNEEVVRIGELLTRYQSVPMSLADACLVRMSEQYSGSSVSTMDSDFLIYRKNRNEIVPVIMPQDV
ncbi:MAG TPA: pilus assembly protein [Cyanobacteria bacterium UBA11372]|nr:pilus assembly protein [Cyanobacteria bacterium UBA11372]